MSAQPSETPHIVCKLCGNGFQPYKAHHFKNACDDCAKEIGGLYYYWATGEISPIFDREGYDRQKARPRSYKKRPIPQWLRWQVFERDEFRCVKCGTHKALRADHIVPESKGGVASMANLQTLCEPCNRSKGARV